MDVSLRQQSEYCSDHKPRNIMLLALPEVIAKGDLLEAKREYREHCLHCTASLPHIPEPTQDYAVLFNILKRVFYHHVRCRFIRAYPAAFGSTYIIYAQSPRE